MDDTQQIYSDAALLDILLSNLIDNAIKYGAENSIITLQQRAQTLTISNTIAPNTALDIERVDERFYRGGHLDIEGTGLGLSIVGNIAQQLGVMVSFDLSETSFTCQLSF